MTGHAVVIAGAGPTGMMLAGELALAGIDVAVVERRVDPHLHGSRAGGLHARTLEVFDQRGLVERFLAQGQVAQVARFAGMLLDISDFPTPHPYGLALWQQHIERILGDWLDELGVPIYRGRAVVDALQDDAGVDVALSDGQSLQARYLVGCDGGRSRVRKSAGIAFRGCEATTSNLIAEVQLTEEPGWGIHRDALGIHSFSKLNEQGLVRVLVTEKQAVHADEPSLHDLSEALIAVYGTDYGVHDPIWLSRFTDATRQAVSYRAGRILLAGDAAHVHPPDGGQGLQIGVQDAVNLGWKLAQVVKGKSPASLLDTYHAERHPIAARVLEHSMVAVALRGDDARTRALHGMFVELLGMDEPRRCMAAMLSGLDIRYDFGEGHPLLGRRMPDLELGTASGPLRVFTLLHEARPILLNFGSAGNLHIASWADRVRCVDASYTGAWQLPVLGTVAAPAAVLIRPDGYVAWTGEPNEPGLVQALTTWFGAPVF